MDWDRRGILGAAGAMAALPMRALAQDGTLPEPPSAVRVLKPFDLEELESEAAKVLAPGPFAFLSGGVGAEWTLHENRRAFGHYVIEPQYLAGKPPPDISTTLMGMKLSAPLLTTPVGGQGLFHATADVGCAQGTSAAGVLMTASGASSNTLEQIAAAVGRGPKWYQIYMPADRGETAELMQRVKAAGYTAVVFTIDALGAGNSEALQRTGFNTGRALGAVSARLTAGAPGAGARRGPQKRSFDWDDVAFLQKTSGLPVLLKGVLSADLAAKAVTRGVAGIQVSNHGGRQLDTVPAAIDQLPAIADAVKGRVPIIVDSGFRRGADVFKALALGADAVALGRPVMYGLALGGPLGVTSVYDKIKAELIQTMQAAGAGKIADISRAHVARAPFSGA
jgi:isopentenyl diphosphate isomerase/L-lactate dehydrogenase-like FMN-dependent dehydrogenase